MDGKNYFTFILIIFSTACAQELNSTELLELIDQFQSTFDINAACSNFTNQPASIGVDISCRQQLDVVCRNASLLLTMLDATSKFPYNGIATSTRLDLGNFDQCVRIDTTADVKNESIRVLGKHCSPGFIIPVIKNNSDAMAIFMDSFKLAICIPDKCSAKDLENITGLPLFNDEFCLTKERQGLSTGDIAILVLFTLFMFMIAASTAYDVHLSRRKLACSNQYLLSFSILTNGKKLFRTSSKPSSEQILVFHGLKAISILWIMAGHSYSTWASLPVLNEDMALKWWNETFYSFYITSAYLAVDTFFYISGFLFAYQYLKQEVKSTKDHISDIPLMYLHRYLSQYDTQSRLIDYGIGFMMGAYMRENKSKPFKLSNVANIFIWTIVLLIMLAILPRIRHQLRIHTSSNFLYVDAAHMVSWVMLDCLFLLPWLWRTTFAIIILVIIASTAYDIYLSRRKITCSNQYLISFSVLTNGKKLFNIPKANNEQILVFHGIKTISMLWIIGGHCYNMWASLPISNQDMALEWRDKTLYSFYITSAYLAVDTFFYISGFLFAYQYLKQEDKPTKNHINDIPLLYLHRYLRLTPALLMIYLLLVGVFNNLTYGPISNFGSQEFVAPCYTNWWSVFLYVQNYYSPEKWCMVNTWYLCADMQIFILAPILAIPVAKRIRKNMRETMIALFFINVFFAILPLINVIWPDLYYNQYDTQSRLIDYGIGFMMGAYMRQNKSKPFKLSSAVNKLIWTLGILVMLAILLIYKVMDINYGFTPHQVFFTLMRPTWCLGLCWIVYSCYHGYGGLINWILTLRCCQIGSRLSYSMYLIHMPLLYVSVANLRERKFFSDYNAFYETCAITVITIVVSIFWTLAFESPIIVLEKYLFKVKINKPKKKNIDIDIKVVENHVENNKI